MSEDEIIPNQVDQSDFENSNEDQIMQEDYPDYSSVQDRPKSPRERNTGERQEEQSNLENETITRSRRPTKVIRPIRFRKM